MKTLHILRSGLLAALLLLIAMPMRASVVLNSTNFPDATFREYISSLTYVRLGGIISDEDIKKVTEIKVENKEITSLKGVEYFTALTRLESTNNKLTSLDVSKNTALKALLCNGNKLTSLDVSKNTALRTLSCYENSITSLDVSKNTALMYLRCEDNKLTSLDVSKNTELIRLWCTGNQLTSLDVSKNTALELLDCHYNSLTSLDVSKCSKLKDLDCGENNLTSLDVSNNTALTDLNCYRNKLTSLNVSKNVALEILNCGSNSLTSLDVSKNTALRRLDCYSNKLTSLNVTQNTVLKNLSCENNQLTYLLLSESQALSYLNRSGQSSTRRFQLMSYGSDQSGNCWALYVGTNEASRIRNLKIDGVSTEPEFAYMNNWLIVSKDLKKIPLKVTYQFDTDGSGTRWMDVKVDYHVVNYGIYIDNKELTSLNFYDIPGLVSGTAFVTDEAEGIGWSGYQPTLVLRDAVIETENGLLNDKGYWFKMDVRGENLLTATDFNAIQLELATQLLLYGGGRLHVKATQDGWNGLHTYDVSEVKLTENTALWVEGDGYGMLDDTGRLTIENGTFCAYGHNYPSVELPAEKDRKFAAGIALRYPEGAYFGDKYHVYYEGTTTDVQNDWVVIGPADAKLPPKETTGIVPINNEQFFDERSGKAERTIDNSAPRYNLAGQRVGNGYKGIVIENGKKRVVK